MAKHSGLRLSVIGVIVVFISLALLAVLPALVASIGIVFGGLLVWGGLMWTIFGYQSSPQGPV
jgi:hypothetical protein